MMIRSFNLSLLICLLMVGCASSPRLDTGSAGNTEGLPACPDDDSSYWDNCFGSYTNSSGNKYVGSFKDNKYHGQGTFYYLEDDEWQGDKYVGEFREDKFHGQGTYYYLADNKWKGDKYIGEFENSRFNGQGTYYFLAESEWKGDKYVGEFKDDYFNGQGTYYYLAENESKGSVLSGEFLDNDANGQGTFIYPNGNKYVGSFTDDKFNGPGTYFYLADDEWKGDKYVGEFKDDKFHGWGSYYHLADNEWNGDVYVGEFRENQYNGLGTYTFSDGETQEGLWEDSEFKSAQKVDPETVKKNSSTTGTDYENEVIPVASGSGFAVTPDGHIVTNHHVIEGCDFVNIHHDGKELESTLIYADPLNDLAVLKAGFSPEQVFSISRRNPQIMQDIFVAGYPFGDEISSSVKVTKGIVSALTGIGNNVSNLQIDAALQPGNSGGPIFDNKGNVVGVAVAKLDLENVIDAYGVVPENTNFGVKSNVVANMLESVGIAIKEAGSADLSNAELGQIMTSATYPLSCWMSRAEARKMEKSKVMFRDLFE